MSKRLRLVAVTAAVSYPLTLAAIIAFLVWGPFPESAWP